MRKAIVTLFCVLALVSTATSLDAQAREGIAVHGHWVIEVRNADGTLAERREFENALMTGGADVVAQLITGAATSGQWSVKLNPTAFDTPAYANSPFLSGGGQAGERSVAVTPTLLPNGFELYGTATADVTGDVVRVETGLAVCFTSLMTPSACLSRVGDGSVNTTFQGRNFTGKSLPTPIGLAAKQIIQVTVTITFS
jgi:hypothetical protein